MTTPTADAIAHFRNIAHPDGRLEQTTEIVTDIHYPATLPSGEVDWETTAHHLADRLTATRTSHESTKALVVELKETITTLSGDANFYRAAQRASIMALKGHWLLPFLPRSVRTAVGLA